jgi:uncharacterized membrane protein YfcA
MSIFDLGGYSVATLAFVAATALLAGLARGFSGFGAALIFIPLASTVVDPRVAAAVLLVVDIVVASPLIPRAWALADRRGIGTMLIGTIVGVPIGTLVLTHTDSVTIRWMIAVMVAIMLTLLISGWRYHGRPAAPVASSVGLVAGFFSGVAQVGGPTVVSYWLGTVKRAEIIRANIVIYFAASALLTFLSYVVAGLISTRLVGLWLLIGPVYGLGLWTGSRCFGMASAATFRGICYALIAAAGIFSLPVLDGVIR